MKERRCREKIGGGEGRELPLKFNISDQLHHIMEGWHGFLYVCFSSLHLIILFIFIHRHFLSIFSINFY